MVKVGQAVSLPAAAWCARQLFWLRLSAHPVPQLFVVALNACSPALAKPQARRGIAPEFFPVHPRCLPPNPQERSEFD